MKHKKIVVIVGLILYTLTINAQNIIDLQGTWNVQLGKNSKDSKRSITLPGTLTEAGYGKKTTGSDFGILTPTHKYIGVAVYEREIEIPKQWKHKNIEVFLERVLWESRVYVDDKELSTQDALGTPHIHQIGVLTPGKHTLSIRVNNEMIHNIGDKGHGYGEYTQSIWNGIVGRIELLAKDPTHFDAIRTFSNIEKDQLKIEMKINAALKEKAHISLEIIEQESNQKVHEIEITEQLESGKNTKEVLLNLQGKLNKWSEFDPCVYILNAKIKTRKSEDNYQTEFGYVQFSHDGTKVTVNGQPVFLRGNLDCVHFPITGYPSTNVEDWMRIFKTYKDYGLNHVRYHSWCPPEAAFKAANRIGIYMQAEASIWIDWWMSEDMVAKGRPEMDTKGHPKGLGKDPKRDKFVIAEMDRVVDYYGNHPSFTMFCIGNELGNADFDVMQEWITDLKKKDPRILYATSTARKVMDVDDYMVTHYIPNVGRTRGLNGPHTDWDFEDVYGQMNIPIIAHEIGQWPVYPSWKEINKYKGVLKARNFEEFKAVAEKNGIDDQDEDFKMASGTLNQIMYKYETESFLRTKSCAGVQLLSMQDYQGQGEALIGWLDAHWDSKGITTPEKFREHFDETVPLLRMEKFIWTNDETFKAKAQLSHYGNSNIDEGEVLITITSSNGTILKEETWSLSNIAIGSLADIGQINYPLDAIEKAEKLTVTLQLQNTPFKNEWNIWVYPEELPTIKNNNIIIAENLNDDTITALENGANVLLLANNLGTEENSVSVDFYPLYWSLTFFPGQGKTSIGMLLKDKHSAFKNFPTDYHSDWQWETFKNTTKGFILNDLPKAYKPIAQVVDDFHRNNKEGAIFEFKVGKGKLLVCGFDITNNENIVAKQLKYSLTEYVNSNDFVPTYEVDRNFLKHLFPFIPKVENVNTNSDFENTILQVNAAGRLEELNTNKPWSNDLDDIEIANGTKYKVKAEGVWKDNQVTAWHGKNMTIEVNCPDGILGSFYVKFNDWNNQGREGFLEFEGRKLKLDKHEGKTGKWVKFHVMREDSNDGKIILKTNASKGGNLMIEEIILVKE
ncbi:glycoside hydrolase family 2 TIM barrel-domain containing protein [Aestuariivivens sp. NBU2969]|uniref:glycoside hydrolase family 2 TIM barrel-domain containing protein n=1 Tax=Aestuariivivens sp. NBU2969 TaxID=2873267 RepID=UPI001CBCBB05|nr:glycoside hydrolase family 2 TIM barrel-domain containing protein [Aestuariivivens sp. NBU2969]